jgi:hypothetical protein
VTTALFCIVWFILMMLAFKGPGQAIVLGTAIIAAFTVIIWKVIFLLASGLATLLF